MRERAEEQYNPMVVVQNYKRIAQVWLDEPRRREFYKEYEIPYEEEKLRKEEVGNMASRISAKGAVRKKLLSLQRGLAASADVVMDGRDIGTTVLPDADVKIYLTAGAHVRASRRYLELTQKGETADIQQIEQDIRKRDEQDMHREISPLRQAEDAVLVDSSEMSIPEVIDRIVAIYREKTGHEDSDGSIVG